MAQSFSIEYTAKGWYTLYDKDDFERYRNMAIGSIDRAVEYLTQAREKVTVITPGSEGMDLVELANGLYDEYEVEGVETTDGCCIDVVHDLWKLAHVVSNLYNQERFAGQIEENWEQFR